MLATSGFKYMLHMHMYIYTYKYTICWAGGYESTMGHLKNIPGDVRESKRYREDSPETICTRAPCLPGEMFCFVLFCFVFLRI